MFRLGRSPWTVRVDVSLFMSLSPEVPSLQKLFMHQSGLENADVLSHADADNDTHLRCNT